jgi:hypothetical protein
MYIVYWLYAIGGVSVSAAGSGYKCTYILIIIVQTPTLQCIALTRRRGISASLESTCAENTYIGLLSADHQ